MVDYPKEIAPLIGELESFILRAFETGRAVGRSEGEEALRSELAGVLNRKPQILIQQSTETEPRHSPAGVRAPKGSVRPAITEVLKHVGLDTGLSPNEILMGVHSLGHPLIKAETIRTTLHKMTAENLVRRSGDRWTLTKIAGSDAGAPEPAN
jgi:hypothetical protein